LPSTRSSSAEEEADPDPAADPVIVMDIKVEEVRFGFEDLQCRTPLKFGGQVIERLTLLDVHLTVSGGQKTARGFGSMPLGNAWSFPSRLLGYDGTLGAMKKLAARIGRILGECRMAGHPIDLSGSLEPEYLDAAKGLSIELRLPDPIPKLCTLVTASPFDAALHDAYGKLHGLNCYQTCGRGFLDGDLSRFLGAEFRNSYLENFVRSTPVERMPMYHLVGAADPLTPQDVHRPVGDGLPECLPEWIRFNGLTHFKIKLNGDDLRWDVDRVLAVDRVAGETQSFRGVSRWFYSGDFNERCRHVDYLLEFLAAIRAQAPAAFERLQYIEQPTARDLKADPGNVMHEAAKLKPIVIDESLTDLETMLLARDMGYTGVALKACKGHSQALLMAAAAQKYEMFLCVQDLTCPGASLIHSAGLAAHVPGVAAIEANARQFIPAANKEWETRFPDLFLVRDGTMRTGTLTGPGLSAV
jgi:L-alanine-DL-glutamate epimerase-like enolase superfamily enzyme